MRAESLFQNRAVRLALSPLLAPASFVYAAALAWDRSRKSSRQRCLPAPVISIGNVTVGGTGKTPVLLRVLADLKTLGLRSAVLTRGYAGAGVDRREGCVFPGGDSSRFSDEVRLVAGRFPDVVIGVGADRSASANRLLQNGAVDVFLLDDGFQHWALSRILDVVCIDVSRPSEKFLLPLGLLREPMSSLVRADVVLLTRCELAVEPEVRAVEEQIRSFAPSAKVLRTSFDLSFIDPDRGSPSAIAPGARVVALSAIGNPASFEAGLRKMGFDVHGLRFPDHHAFSPADLSAAASEAGRLGATFVVTEKDWVKLKTTAWANSEDRPPLQVAVQTLKFLDGGETVWTKAIAEAVKTNL